MSMRSSPLVAAEPTSGHIVWDWNGTLLQDGSQIMGAVAAAFRSLDLAEVTIPRHQEMFRRPVRLFFNDLAGRELSDAEYVRLYDRFQQHYAEHDLRECVSEDTIQALKVSAMLGFTQSILSMCPHQLLTVQLRDLGLEHYFGRIEGHSGSGPDAKSTHLSAHLSALDGVDPRSVVLIGDTTDDAHAATTVGVKCVLYHSGRSALQSAKRLAGTGCEMTSSLPYAVMLARTTLP